MNQGFPYFQRKLEAYLDELEATNLFQNSSAESSINYYSEIQRDWQKLKKHYRQIENAHFGWDDKKLARFHLLKT